MAKQAGSAAQNRDSFEEANMQALDVLYEQNQNFVDFDSQNAEYKAALDKIINADVRTKIQETMGNHVLLFQRALGRETEKDGSDEARRAAFKRVFSKLYGKHRMEAEAGGEEHNKPLMEAYKRVLKYEIDEKTGLKGRSGLQAAASRLKMVGNAAELKKDRDTTLATMKDSRDKAQRYVEKLNGDGAVINETNTQVEGLDVTADIEGALASFTANSERDQQLEDRLAELTSDRVGNLQNERSDASNDFKEHVKRIGDLHYEFREVADTLLNYYASTYPESELRQLLSDFDVIVSELYNADSKTVDFREFPADRWQAFFEGRLQKFVGKIKNHKNPVLQGRVDSIKALIKGLNQQAGSRSRSFFEILRGRRPTNENAVAVRFERVLQKIKENKKNRLAIRDSKAEQGVEKNTISLQLFARFKFIESNVQNLKRPAVEALMPGMAVDADKYLQGFALLESLDPADVTETVLRAFVNDVYQPFLSAVRAKVAAARGTNSTELANVERDLNGFIGRIGKMEKYDLNGLSVEEILKTAFSRGNPARIKKLEREHASAQETENDIKSTREYFSSGKGIEETVDSYNELSSLLAQAQVGDASESFQARKFRVKAEYDAISAQRPQNQNQGKNRNQIVDGRLRAKGKEIEDEITNRLGSDVQAKDLVRPAVETETLSTHAKEIKDELDRRVGYDPVRVAAEKPVVEAEILSKYAQEIEDEIVRRVTTNANARKTTKPEVEAEMRAQIETELAEEEATSSIGLALGRAKRMGPKQREFELLQKAETQSKALYEKLKALLKMLKKAQEFGVELKKDGKDFDLGAFTDKFDKLNLDSDQFSPWTFVADFKDLIDFAKEKKNVEKLAGQFDEKLAGAEQDTKDAKKAIDDAKALKGKNENLTDPEAAVRIVETIIAEQIKAGQLPEMTLEQQGKLAKMIIAGDVAILQSKLSYEELATRMSAEALDTAKQMLFKEKLIGFRYKKGDKVEKLFKGLKPENFATPEAIEHLFKIGRLRCDMKKAKDDPAGIPEHMSAFIALVAFKNFDGDENASAQAIKIEELIKYSLAKQLAVDDKIHEEASRAVVDDAFSDQLELISPKIKEFFDLYDANASDWNAYKAQELDLKYQKLAEEHRLGKIDDKVFAKRKAEILEEADEYGIKDKLDFAQASVMKDFWERSDFSKWLKDRAYDVGQLLKGKAKVSALGALGMGVRLPWEVTKMGIRLPWEAGRMTGRVGAESVKSTLRVGAKYPLMIAAKPLVGFINLIRTKVFGKDKWQPIGGVIDSVRADFNGAWENIKGTGGKMVENVKGTGGKMVENTVATKDKVKTAWGESVYKRTEYKDRTKVNLEELEATANELKVKTEIEGVEFNDAVLVDFDAYKKRLTDLAKPAEQIRQAA